MHQPNKHTSKAKPAVTHHTFDAFTLNNAEHQYRHAFCSTVTQPCSISVSEQQ